MKKLIPLTCLCAALGGASVFGATWVQSVRSGLWSDGTTWNIGTEPDTLDTAVMRNSNAVTLDSAATVVSVRLTSGGTLNITDGADLHLRTMDNGNGAQWIGGIDTAGSSTLMDGGKLVISRGATAHATMTIAMGQTMASSASFTQTGGEIYINGMMSIGGSYSGTSYANTGSYTLNGGSLYIHASTATTAASGSTYVGWACGIESKRGTSAGVFTWTSGTLSANYVREHVYNTGTGVLSIDSVNWNTDTSDAYANYSTVTSVNKIGKMSMSDFYMNGSSLAAVQNNLNYNQGANAKMIIDVQGAAEGQYDQLRWVGGSTSATSAGGTVYLTAGTTIDINLIEGWALNVGDTLDVILAGNTVNVSGGTVDDLVLGGTHGQYFSAEIVDTILTTNSYGDTIAGTNMYADADEIGAQALRLTFNGIPEPSAAAALLGVLALAFVARRRR